MEENIYLACEKGQYTLSFGNGTPNQKCLIGTLSVLPTETSGKVKVLYRDHLHGDKTRKVTSESVPAETIEELVRQYAQDHAKQIIEELSSDPTNPKIQFIDLTRFKESQLATKKLS